jgi:TonB family protein
MNLSYRLLLLAIPVWLFCGLASAQIENGTGAAKQESDINQALPKAAACPAPAGTGVVLLRIVIDTKGNVSEAKALSGAEKFFAFAETCAKTWKFAHPASAPVTRNVYISFYSRDCSGPESQHGEIEGSWGLRDKYGNVVAYVDGDEPSLPVYPEEQRKAGVAGWLVLSVSLNADGSVKEIQVLHGLSPALDKAVLDELRTLKFKTVEDSQTQHLRFQMIFHATCPLQSVTNEN